MFGTQEVKGNSRSPWRAVRPYMVVLLILGLCSTVILLSWRNASLVANGARPLDVHKHDAAATEALRARRQREREREARRARAEEASTGGHSRGSGGGRDRRSSRERSRGRSHRSSSSSRSSTAQTPPPPSPQSRSRQRRERHREKERIDKTSVDFRNISDSIIAHLSIPKTKVYERKFPNGSRLVVNKKNPENRLAHTQQEKSPSNLPATDIEERFGSCAVVGNSGISLFNEKQGEAIDKHDLVIRFNDGPTTGFEKYVGKRTSYRFINNNWSRIFTKREPRGCAEGALISFGNGALRFLHALRAKYGERRPAYFMAPEFALNARGTYKKAYAVMDEAGYIRVKGRNSPPTGIEGVFFGLEMCDTVDLYGFQIRNDPKIKYHYHNEVQGVEAAHSFGFQYEFLKVLTHGGFIQVCLPETKSGSCVNGGKKELKARAARDARGGASQEQANVAEHSEDEEVEEAEEVHEIEESGDVEMAEEIHETEEEGVVLEE